MDLNEMICFPERRIFVSPDHNWAFYAWEVARECGWTEPLATLVHVDTHLDDLHDGVEVEGFYDISNLRDAYYVAEEIDLQVSSGRDLFGVQSIRFYSSQGTRRTLTHLNLVD